MPRGNRVAVVWVSANTAAAKAGSLVEPLAARLKACPDTNLRTVGGLFVSGHGLAVGISCGGTHDLRHPIRDSYQGTALAMPLEA